MNLLPGCSHAYHWRRRSPRTFFVINADSEVRRRLEEFAQRWEDSPEDPNGVLVRYNTRNPIQAALSVERQLANMQSELTSIRRWLELSDGSVEGPLQWAKNSCTNQEKDLTEQRDLSKICGLIPCCVLSTQSRDVPCCVLDAAALSKHSLAARGKSRASTETGEAPDWPACHRNGSVSGCECGTTTPTTG